MTTKADALATRPIDDLKSLLEKAKPALQAILPRHVTAERLIKTALVAVNRHPLLLQCTRDSILLALMQAAELGLEVGSLIGGAHLVPYRNKKGEFLAQCIPDYRGLIDLARRSGAVNVLSACCVHEKDVFRLRRGTTPEIFHEPAFVADPGAILGFYAVATLQGGHSEFDVMTKAEVDAIRSRSRAKDDGPWVTDYEAMGKKTVIRRLCKLLPRSREFMKALEIEEAAEMGELLLPESALDALTAMSSGDPAPPRTKAAEVKAALQAQPPDAAPPAGGDRPPPPDAAGQPIPLFHGGDPGPDDPITPTEIEAALAAGKESVEREIAGGTVSTNLANAGLVDRPTLEAARTQAAEAVQIECQALMWRLDWAPEKRDRFLAEYRGREPKLLKHLKSQAARLLAPERTPR